VNIGGWLVLEPWITPGIFEEVNVGELQVENINLLVQTLNSYKLPSTAINVFGSQINTL
jgi:hypothetical protein